MLNKFFIFLKNHFTLNHFYIFVGTEEQFLERINGMNKAGSGVSVQYILKNDGPIIIKSNDPGNGNRGESSIDIIMDYKKVDQNIFLVEIKTKLRLESLFLGGLIFIISILSSFGIEVLFSITSQIIICIVGIAAIFFFNLLQKVQEETLIEKTVKLLKLKVPSEGRTTEL
ncbi:MAG: hypothetical protein ACK40G_00430 [Cytophagaceae bacterium]